MESSTPPAGTAAVTVTTVQDGRISRAADLLATEVPVAQPSEWQKSYQRFHAEQLALAQRQAEPPAGRANASVSAG